VITWMISRTVRRQRARLRWHKHVAADLAARLWTADRTLTAQRDRTSRLDTELAAASARNTHLTRYLAEAKQQLDDAVLQRDAALQLRDESRDTARYALEEVARLQARTTSTEVRRLERELAQLHRAAQAQADQLAVLEGRPTVGQR
jgi:hypothetical protein